MAFEGGDLPLALEPIEQGTQRAIEETPPVHALERSLCRSMSRVGWSPGAV
jgi:hypothetical protein